MLNREPIEPADIHATPQVTPELKQQFQIAHEVIDILVQKHVLDAIHKECGPAKNFFTASSDLFRDEDGISWREIMIVLAAFSFGGLACSFIPAPAGKAAEILADLIYKLTGHSLRGIQVLKILLQICGTTEAFALSTLSANKMFHYYFDKHSDEEIFLKENRATWTEIITTIFLKSIYLISAVTANIPIFFVSNLIWELAAASAAANTGITWKGISDLTNSLRSAHPARQLEIGLLQDELQKYINLPEATQLIILDEIEALDHIQDPAIKSQSVNLRLLTLSRTNAELEQSFAVPNPSTATKWQEGVHISTGLLCGGAEVYSFATQAGVGVNSLFANRRDPGPVTLGVATVFSSTPSCFGFGSVAGYNAAKKYTQGNKSVAAIANPWLYQVFSWGTHAMSTLAAGMFFTLGYATTNNIISIADIKRKAAYTMRLLLPALCYSGATIEFDYYTMAALDETYIHYAQRCSNPNTRRILNLVLGAKKCYAVLAESNDKNYFSILKHKLEDPGRLGEYLRSAFKQRSENYEQMLADINHRANKNVEPPIHKENKPSLWCRLFGIVNKDQPVADIESGLELSTRNTV